MEYVYFIIYLSLLFGSIPHIGFVKNGPLSPKTIRFILAFKILAGFACAYYFKHLLPGTDYLLHNEEGIIEYQLLLKDPVLFFTDFNIDLNKYGTGGVFEASNSFWGYLRFHILYKYLAVQNLISQGNFYLNAGIFSSVIFWGHLAFFRVFYGIYNRHKPVLLAVAFFLPSIVLYFAVPNKDGLVFLGVAFISYIFYKYTRFNKISWKGLLILILSFLCIFLLRNFILLALLPALLAGIASKKFSRYRVAMPLLLYSIFIALFFATGSLNNSFDLPEAVVKRKNDFALLEKGRTDLPMRILEPTTGSFIKNIPQAFNHGLLRPYPFEFNIGSTLASLEIYFYLLIFLLFLLTGKKITRYPIHPFNIFGLAFSITMIFIIGFTIPNAGAIIRYRSIIWIFLLSPVVCRIFDRYQLK